MRARTLCPVVVQEHDLHTTTVQCSQVTLCVPNIALQPSHIFALHSSYFSLHTSHFALHLSSSHLIPSHLITLRCHLNSSQLIIVISSEHTSTLSISSKLFTTSSPIFCASDSDKTITVRQKLFYRNALYRIPCKKKWYRQKPLQTCLLR